MLTPEELDQFVSTYRATAVDVLDEPPEAIDVQVDLRGDGGIEVRLFIHGEPASRHASFLVNNAVRGLLTH